MGMDAQNNPIYDRAVTAQFYRQFWSKYFTDGVFANPSNNYQVLSTGSMSVKVPAGSCGHIQGVTFIEDADVTVAIAAPDGVNNRTDRIVLQLSQTDRTVSVIVKKGSTALTRNSNIWELGLADVAVAKNAAQINQADITDLRLNTSACGIVAAAVTNIDTTSLFNQYLGWYNTTVASYGSWFSKAQADITTLQTFYFDNDFELPGCTKTSYFNGYLNFFEYWRTSGGVLVAARTTYISTDYLTQTVYTSLYNADGSIKKERLAVTKIDPGTLNATTTVTSIVG